jgi:hypothetical protein
MIRRLAVAIAAVAGICSAIPAGAAEVGIDVGPGGVTIGSDRGDRSRDRDHRTTILNNDRDRDRDRDHRTIIINKDHNRDGDRDRDRRSIVIDRN